MADDVVAENDNSSDYPVASSGLSCLFQRRIEFHPARKTFKGFDNGGGDFRLETLNPTSSYAQKSCSNLASKGKQLDGSEFSENGLDPELSFEITFRRIGAGLENLGNTCFLNSVLQCLTYTEPLAAYLQSGKHQNSCHVAGFCALCAIQKHVSRALQSSGRILAPKDLVSNLRCISRNFRNARQEDAHEYMVNLLESMHKCCLPSGLPTQSPSAYEKSLVHKIFGGCLRSQVKCMQCSYCSNTFDPFLDLSLEIVQSDSLYKAFKNFTAPEMLDGGEREYQCQRCKQKVKAIKQLTVSKAPYVLSIHLKRFRSYNLEEKIHKKIQFGPTFDLKPFVSGSYPDGDLKYTLYGVLVHRGGSTRSGHYYCYVRTSSGMWYALDDNRVSHVGDRIVFEQQAYMLFYVRDRRKVVPKKPVDVDLKENIKTSVSVNPNKTNPIVNQGVPKKPVDVDLKEDVRTSADPNRRDSIVSQCMKNGAQDHILERKVNAPPREDLRNHSSSMGLLKTTILNGGSSSLMENVRVSEKCSLKITSPEDLPSLPRCVRSNIVAPHSENSSTKEANMEINHVDGGSIMVATSLNLADVTASATPQAVDISNRNPLGHSSPEDASNCKELELNESNKVSSSSNMLDGPLLAKTLDCKQGRGLKRKKLMYPFASLHHSSNILFKVSLSLRKKKNHKRRKRRSVGSKNLADEGLFGRDCTLSDFAPSTSEAVKTVHLVSTCKSRKKAKHDSKVGNGKSMESTDNNVEKSTIKVDKECGKRSEDGNSALATDNELKCSTGSIVVANHNELSGAKCPKDSSRSANNRSLHGALTNGFEDIVGQWDGITLPSSVNQFNATQKNVSIGYVADEWDEEYDQGKRKKIREFKHTYGGPNPFQEIASMKSQLKKKRKVERFSSGNEPFRIL